MSCHADAISAIGDLVVGDATQERLDAICKLADDAVARARWGCDDHDSMRVAVCEASLGLSETIHAWVETIHEETNDTATG